MVTERPSSPHVSKPSSGSLYVTLGANEMHTLDMIATEIVLDQDLPMASRDACDVLYTHGFVRRHKVARHGPAWGITEAGQAYLIRHYKSRGARV